ncbi:MAG: ABC-2 transporter permease [Oscillospiraceae bacterium]|nr:ABC-2 transporter permease [Oscillospiraceae bacterium]
MKGLLLKDWYLTVKYLRIYLIGIALFLATSVFNPQNSFFMAYPSVMVAMMPVTLYSYDDREKWTVYAQAFPVSRAQYVTEKYLYGAICTALYLALQAVLYLAFDREGLGDAVTVAISLGLLASAIMLPILFRFGAEKGRIAYLVFAGAVFGGVGIAYVADRPTSRFDAFPVPNWALCVFPLLLYVLSWRLSIALYKKREL